MTRAARYEIGRGERGREGEAPPTSGDRPTQGRRTFFGDEGIVAFSESMAATAAEVFRSLGSPRRRAADIAIGVTEAAAGAVLLTRNARDFARIPELTIEEID